MAATPCIRKWPNKGRTIVVLYCAPMKASLPPMRGGRSKAADLPGLANPANSKVGANPSDFECALLWWCIITCLISWPLNNKVWIWKFTKSAKEQVDLRRPNAWRGCPWLRIDTNSVAWYNYLFGCSTPTTVVIDTLWSVGPYLEQHNEVDLSICILHHLVIFRSCL